MDNNKLSVRSATNLMLTTFQQSHVDVGTVTNVTSKSAETNTTSSIKAYGIYQTDTASNSNVSKATVASNSNVSKATVSGTNSKWRTEPLLGLKLLMSVACDVLLLICVIVAATTPVQTECEYSEQLLRWLYAYAAILLPTECVNNIYVAYRVGHKEQISGCLSLTVGATNILGYMAAAITYGVGVMLLAGSLMSNPAICHGKQGLVFGMSFLTCLGHLVVFIFAAIYTLAIYIDAKYHSGNKTATNDESKSVSHC